MGNNITETPPQVKNKTIQDKIQYKSATSKGCQLHTVLSGSKQELMQIIPWHQQNFEAATETQTEK